ncbi:hypothetical protein CYPRO_2349 [Cyclonatronum proteinivorum]|uniref:Uncharacterized protein n=1 Tax=Cyclonatronum proteinivorum TaxID=1457365 RepID=A0A345UM89_9BACT|nr:hypothetical protein CYPRO_2349 [Cyclonatronum proteinivorum]
MRMQAGMEIEMRKRLHYENAGFWAIFSLHTNRFPNLLSDRFYHGRRATASLR